MRVGYAIGAPALIAELHKLRDSYNVNRISQAAALGALAGAQHYRTCCDAIIRSRAELTTALTQRGFRVHASQGNFIFARHPRAAELYQQLKARKILVRYFTHSGLADGLRITIGMPEENTGLLTGLDQIL